MDGILILLAISYALGLPAAVIYLLVANSGLARRVRALEADMPRPAQGVTGPRPQPTPQAEPQKTSADVLAPLDPDTPFDPAAPSTRPPPPAETPEPQGPVDPPPPIEQDAVPAAFVLRKEKAAALAAWMRDNWFFAVAALSLGLAGVFFVQYGIEQGLLTPTMRVAGAVGLVVAADRWAIEIPRWVVGQVWRGASKAGVAVGSAGGAAAAGVVAAGKSAAEKRAEKVAAKALEHDLADAEVEIKRGKTGVVKPVAAPIDEEVGGIAGTESFDPDAVEDGVEDAADDGEEWEDEDGEWEEEEDGGEEEPSEAAEAPPFEPKSR